MCLVKAKVRKKRSCGKPEAEKETVFFENCPLQTEGKSSIIKPKNPAKGKRERGRPMNRSERGGVGTGGKENGTQRNRMLRRRTVELIGFFCVICAVFCARLVYYQVFARDKYAPAEDGTRETVYIEASRGNICDRNGKVLVTNRTTYTFQLDYATIPDTRAELNGVLLTALDAMDAAGGTMTRPTNLCPFTGTYPDIEFCEEFTTNGAMYDEFDRLLEKNFVTSKKSLEQVKAENSAATVAAYYARAYKIVKETKDKDGNVIGYTSDYSAEDITRLIAVRYEMDRRGFGANQPFVFASSISFDFSVYIRELDVPGLAVGETVSREYVYPGYASHILGLTGQIYQEDWPTYKEKGYDMDARVGISGCEAVFEDYLRGTRGIYYVYKNANGQVTKTEEVRAPIDGKDVWLTIDIDVQIAAEDALKENIESIAESASGERRGEDANAGAVVAMDPNTGALLALASYPSFDLTTYNKNYNLLQSNPDAPLLNRALQAVYAPGSTFKVGMALAALESGIITEKSTYLCEGYYWRYGARDAFKCAVYPGRHGYLNVSRGLELSCNCFFYEVGHYLGIDTMNAWCRLYGLGEATGIELSERIGILAGEDYRESHPDFCRENGLDAWKIGDTWQAAIGQSDNAFTPLQISSYISAIVNGGTRYAAHLLHSVHAYGETEEDVLLVEKEKQVLGTIPLHTSNLSVIKEAMRKVVSGEDAAWPIYRNFHNVSYSVGAKTGTAQAGTKHSDNAWFAGFAPVENPQIQVTCMIEHGASGSNAAYTVRKLMDAYLLGKTEAKG